jgi:hypothetical protein
MVVKGTVSRNITATRLRKLRQRRDKINQIKTKLLKKNPISSRTIKSPAHTKLLRAERDLFKIKYATKKIIKTKPKK